MRILTRFLVLFALCALGFVATLAFAEVAKAETSVHGYTIPTVSEESSPLRVCTTTRTRQWSNEGSNDTQAMHCQPTAGSRRTVSFEEAVEAAAFLSENVNFGFDSAVLSPEAIERIQTIATFLAEEPAATLDLAGHADAAGPEEYNFGLSERRAGAAQALFVEAGVSIDRIFVIWFGERELLIDTPGPEFRNRRVEITISR